MAIDAGQLAARLSFESGLEFASSGNRIADGGQRVFLQPAHHPPAHTFAISVQIGWRSVELEFKPGNFASDLLEAMRNAEADGRAGFVSVLRTSVDEGGEVSLVLNGTTVPFEDPGVWSVPWQRVSLIMRKGMLPIGLGDSKEDDEVVGRWVSRLSAAVLALLPLEADESLDLQNPAESVAGLPEGSRLKVQVNRYERDRRNRAAALAIHGHACVVCRVELADRYGAPAAGLIEVHHTTPVSELGPNYIIDPRTDLVPLCPNCHAVAHRRSPPYTVEELRMLMMTSAPASGPLIP